MRHERPSLPARTDIRTRRQQAAAYLMVGGLHLAERLVARLVVDVRPPNDDPFYRAPDRLDEARPGEVLDARPVQVRALRRVIAADAWQVRFRSTDSRGAAAAGITTVMASRRRRSGSVRPLLSYQCAIDSLGPGADPSYTLRQGSQKELPFIALALRRGWTVVATDYTGPRHAFGVGLVAARFVLDGIRAALAFEPAGLDASTPVGLWGYSGGAQATVAAAEQHPGYAPELRLVCAAAGGVPADPTSSTRIFEDGSLFSGLALGASLGISRESPDVDLLGAATDRGRALLASAADMTMEQLVMSFPFLHWGEYLTVPSVFEVPGMRSALEANRLGQATPVTALYLYHAVHDQNLAIADVDKLVDAYRRASADVTYRRLRFGEHLIVMLTGAPGSLRFLQDRLDRPVGR